MGTGKTLIARNIGKLISPNKEPIVINGPEILNKFVGQSEENLRKAFKSAIDDYNDNGDDSSLHIIIFDEIDAICRKRGSTQSHTTDTIVNQLLAIMDGVNKLNNIFVIGMTNRIELLDPALLRPCRFEIKVEIGLPDNNWNNLNKISNIIKIKNRLKTILIYGPPRIGKTTFISKIALQHILVKKSYHIFLTNELCEFFIKRFIH